MAGKSPTLMIGGTEYDVNRDFTWRELLTVEELSGIPLARDDAFESFAVLGAFVFIVRKRDDEKLMWEGFLDSSIQDLTGGDDEPDAKPAAKRAAKRPTKPAA